MDDYNRTWCYMFRTTALPETYRWPICSARSEVNRRFVILWCRKMLLHVVKRLAGTLQPMQRIGMEHGDTD